MSKKWINAMSVISQINLVFKKCVCIVVGMTFQNKVSHFTGVLMWEVYSEGRFPYENYSNSEVVDTLNSGLRLLKPRLAPETVHIVMEWCWKEVSAGLNCVPCRRAISVRKLEVGGRGSKRLQDCAWRVSFLSVLALTETRRAADLCSPAAWARQHGRCVQLREGKNKQTSCI